jgi:DNA replication protein DnaC
MKGSAAGERLLERNDELARIASALADARTGHGRFVVIEGPAGIGKTALLAAARTEAAESGLRVLRARATEMVKGLAPLVCKTARIDAWVLAGLSRRDLVPAIWLPGFE